MKSFQSAVFSRQPFFPRAEQMSGFACEKSSVGSLQSAAVFATGLADAYLPMSWNGTF